MDIELREYVDVRGHNNFREWLSKLDPGVRARVIKSVFRMGEGNFSGAKPEGEGVSALRLDFGPGYRIYFAKDGELLVILLAGGTKRRQDDDIRLARSLWSRVQDPQAAEFGGEIAMALTRSFRETVMEELRDKEFRRAFLSEAINDMLAGDLDSAKTVLREYINGTVGFIKLGKALRRSPKSLMRMLSQEGNPQARNLLELVAYLQKSDGVVAEVRLDDSAAA